jgi:hypothetical protein
MFLRESETCLVKWITWSEHHTENESIWNGTQSSLAAGLRSRPSTGRKEKWVCLPVAIANSAAIIFWPFPNTYISWGNGGVFLFTAFTRLPLFAEIPFGATVRQFYFLVPVTTWTPRFNSANPDMLLNVILMLSPPRSNHTKVKLSLGFIKHNAVKSHWRIIVQLHTFLTSALHERSASRPGNCAPMLIRQKAGWGL